MLILGLDISTSCTGVCIYENLTNTIIKLDHIDFKGCDNVWDKCDRARDYINNLDDYREIGPGIQMISIEDAAKKFASGKSTAKVIVTLAKFNGLVSLFARDKFKIDPIYLSPGEARRAIGLKMKMGKGIPYKEQVFQYMNEHDLSHINWPLTPKSKKIVGWAYDETDAYVLAKAGGILYG